MIKTPTQLHEIEKNMIICGLIVITGTKEQLGAEKEQIERNSRKTGDSAAAPTS